jgi:RNA 2',3'-cyclic 3'-phosphodiesterase
MPRLFVGLEIPATIRKALACLQERVPRSSRLSPLDQWHLTLVFIGQAELPLVQAVLTGITHRTPKIILTKPGCFGAKQRLTYWIGAEPTQALCSLYQAVLADLQNAGLQPDGKPFVPHITLARDSTASPDERDRFLQQRIPPGLEFYPAEFCLYSSETQPTGPTYRVEGRYRLD